jgi:hypothetical protein
MVYACVPLSTHEEHGLFLLGNENLDRVIRLQPKLIPITFQLTMPTRLTVYGLSCTFDQSGSNVGGILTFRLRGLQNDDLVRRTSASLPWGALGITRIHRAGPGQGKMKDEVERRQIFTI